eukprot:11591540-Karenia_brevis.AAC.1
MADTRSASTSNGDYSRGGKHHFGRCHWPHVGGRGAISAKGWRGEGNAGARVDLSRCADRACAKSSMP